MSPIRVCRVCEMADAIRVVATTPAVSHNTRLAVVVVPLQDVQEIAAVVL